MTKIKGDDLIGKLIKASSVISEKRQGEGDYIQITEERIVEMALELEISFDEMVILLKDYLGPKT
jgi:hypothetical protein